MKTTCVHSCKGLCAALETAEHHEEEAIKEYRRFVAECDYPEVRVLLEELVRERERALGMLRAQREVLAVKFATIDRINESFS
jgi:rubrerythrin